MPMLLLPADGWHHLWRHGSGCRRWRRWRHVIDVIVHRVMNRSNEVITRFVRAANQAVSRIESNLPQWQSCFKANNEISRLWRCRACTITWRAGFWRSKMTEMSLYPPADCSSTQRSSNHESQRHVATVKRGT